MKIIKQYGHILIAVLLALLIKLCVPAANGLTDLGINVLAVLIPVLYLWLTVGTDWVSLFALAGIVISGIMTPSAVYGGSLGGSTIVVIITCMGLSKVLSDTGVIRKIANWFLTRNIVRNKPYVFIAMFFLAVTLVGLTLYVGTVCIIFITLASEICEEIGYKKGDPFYTALIIGVFWLSNVSNVATPIGHATTLIMLGTAAEAGFSITYTQWMMIGLPFALCMYLLTLLTVCVIWKPEAAKFTNYDLDAARKSDQPFTREGITALAVFVCLIATWILPEVFPVLLPEAVKTALKTWGTGVPAIFAVCLLCVIRVNGKPVAKFSELSKATSISLIVFVGAVVVLGNAISSSDTGISLAISNILSPLTESIPAIAFVAISILFCLIMTNFVSNVVSMLLFFGLVIPVTNAAAISPVGISIIICIAASFASLVPSAATTAPLFFGPGHITVKNTLKWNLLMIGFCYLVCMLILYPLGNLLF